MPESARSSSSPRTPATERRRAAAVRAVASALLLIPHAAFASQGPGVSEGTADPITQATAAAMVLFPIVAILVFAVAKALGFIAADDV